MKNVRSTYGRLRDSYKHHCRWLGRLSWVLRYTPSSLCTVQRKRTHRASPLRIRCIEARLGICLTSCPESAHVFAARLLVGLERQQESACNTVNRKPPTIPAHALMLVLHRPGQDHCDCTPYLLDTLRIGLGTGLSDWQTRR